MRRVAILVGALVMTVATQGGAQSGSGPDVRKVTDAFVAAWAKGDAKALAALHAEGAVRTNPQGQFYVGRAMIEKSFAESFAGPLKGSTLVVTTGEERNVGPDVVVSTGTWEVKGGTPPAGAVMKGVYLNTLVRQGGRWVIASSAPMGVTPMP